MDLAVLTPDDIDSLGKFAKNKYSPLMDVHCQHVREIQKAIAELCVDLRPKDVDIAKLCHAGKTHKEIAAEVGFSERNVIKILHKPEIRRLTFHLNLLRETIDAPNKTRRLHTLWRIAVDNENIRPKTAIDAIAEINRMTGGHTNGECGGMTIIINNQVLGRGPLD